MIIQTDSLNITSNGVNFYSGYHSMNFVADKVGRHILLFVLNNQPSQAIIVDVISQAPPAHTIRVFDGVNNYEKPMYFERGVAKVINVPPATTVYAKGGLY